jgi:hypothetical protein
VIGYINEIRARARNWNGTQVDFPADLTGAENLPKRSEKKDDWNWRLNTRDGMTSNVGELVMKCSREQTHWNLMMNLDAAGIIIFHFHRMSWIEMRI